MIFLLKHLAETECLVEYMHIELEFLFIQSDRTFSENASAFLIAFTRHYDPAENMVNCGKREFVTDF